MYLSPSQVFHQRLTIVAHVVNVDPIKTGKHFLHLKGLGLCIYMTHDDLYEPFASVEITNYLVYDDGPMFNTRY